MMFERGGVDLEDSLSLFSLFALLTTNTSHTYFCSLLRRVYHYHYYKSTTTHTLSRPWLDSAATLQGSHTLCVPFDGFSSGALFSLPHVSSHFQIQSLILLLLLLLLLLMLFSACVCLSMHRASCTAARVCVCVGDLCFLLPGCLPACFLPQGHMVAAAMVG